MSDTNSVTRNPGIRQTIDDILDKHIERDHLTARAAMKKQDVVSWMKMRETEMSLKTRYKRRERRLLNRVHISFQGELIKAKCQGALDRPGAGGVRAAISRFSPRARKNMLETVSRIQWQGHKATFITLTYHIPEPNPQVCKSHLRAFQKRLYRKFGELANIWRLEPQEERLRTRNELAWHFHLIVWDMPYWDWKDMLKNWQEIINQPTTTQVDIEVIATAKKARSYISKYVGKNTQDFAYLDYLTNLAADLTPGRYWGIENRKNLPLAELITWVIDASNEFSGYFDFKRACRHMWDGINGSRFEGFTLFVGNIANWERMLHLLCRAENSAKCVTRNSPSVG